MKNHRTPMKKTGRKGITPIVAIILLLLMTIAAAGAAYLWINRLQTLISDSAFSNFMDTEKKRNTRFMIDSMWNVSDVLHIVVRNAGTYDIPSSDLDNAAVYIDNQFFQVRNAPGAGVCSYDPTALAGAFYADNAIVLDCGTNSYAYVGPFFPKVVVKVQPPYGAMDIQTYQFNPQS